MIIELDRAEALAKEVLAQIKKLDAMCRLLDRDPTEVQELAISVALRNYYIEKAKDDHQNMMSQFNAATAKVREGES